MASLEQKNDNNNNNNNNNNLNAINLIDAALQEQIRKSARYITAFQCAPDFVLEPKTTVAEVNLEKIADIISCATMLRLGELLTNAVCPYTFIYFIFI